MTATVAAVAACSEQKPGEVAKDGSVTVKHMFGETKIPAAPKRVVSAGYTEQDDLLAVGVVRSRSPTGGAAAVRGMAVGAVQTRRRAARRP